MSWRIYFPAALAAAMAAVGSWFTMQGLEDWYPGLAKPDWTPPGPTIGAAWTVIYVLFALAGARYFSAVRSAGSARLATGLIAVNAALSVAWSWLFFVRHEVYLAFWEMLALELSVLALILAYRKVSGAAALMLAPYALWLVFAGYLNWRIYQMNG